MLASGSRLPGLPITAQYTDTSQTRRSCRQWTTRVCTYSHIRSTYEHTRSVTPIRIRSMPNREFYCAKPDRMGWYDSFRGLRFVRAHDHAHTSISRPHTRPITVGWYMVGSYLYHGAHTRRTSTRYWYACAYGVLRTEYSHLTALLLYDWATEYGVRQGEKSLSDGQGCFILTAQSRPTTGLE